MPAQLHPHRKSCRNKAINEYFRYTASEINKDMNLTLTGQNENANPFTGKIKLMLIIGKTDRPILQVT